MQIYSWIIIAAMFLPFILKNIKAYFFNPLSYIIQNDICVQLDIFPIKPAQFFFYKISFYW